MVGVEAQRKRVLIFGATGTIGRATVRAAVDAGHDVTCFLRPTAGAEPPSEQDGATLAYRAVTDPGFGDHPVWGGEPFDCVISCLASRTGAPDDAWAVDYRANQAIFAAAKAHGVTHVILLSAICVQKPRLAFQHAKLAAENELIESGLNYTIARPTAFFKSLSGQIDRVIQGKPYLVFGDGKLTACKPISDRDMGRFLIQCINDETAQNQILPIGGPGPALTPMDQGTHLFALLGRDPKFKHVPLGLMKMIAWCLGTLSKIIPKLAAKAEFARIGTHYASESMLVWDDITQDYAAGATPSFGDDTIFDYYAEVIDGKAQVERGDHSFF